MGKAIAQARRLTIKKKLGNVKEVGVRGEGQMHGRNKGLALFSAGVFKFNWSRCYKQFNGDPSNAILILSLNCFALQEFNAKISAFA